ncbi:hypothetical protein D8I35_09520 [Corticibacter populi]|uniref:Uncharacterized protein n=1 Tax=Corticibacter populi TaxID=1550736 RepID=A0A3M6QUN3_9BURK|nr:hypothetical protein D8I35_09520 [Corticibacter populi]
MAIAAQAVEVAAVPLFAAVHLIALLAPDTAPSRREVMAIAFWTCLGFSGFVLALMAAFEEKPNQEK